MQVMVRQGLLAQPLQQLRAVIGLQNVGQRVAARGCTHAMGCGQQMQVVVAQQAAQRAIGGHAAAQHRGRLRPPVDQIAEQVNGVAAGREIHAIEQALQRKIAALDVSNTVKCHGVLCNF